MHTQPRVSQGCLRTLKFPPLNFQRQIQRVLLPLLLSELITSSTDYRLLLICPSSSRAFAVRFVWKFAGLSSFVVFVAFCKNHSHQGDEAPLYPHGAADARIN